MIKIFFLSFFFMGIYASAKETDSISVKKNMISFCIVPSINGVIDNNTFYNLKIENGYSTSFKISYKRFLSPKIALSVFAALEQQKFKQKMVFIDKYTIVPHYGYTYHTSFYSDIKTHRAYKSIGIDFSFQLINIKKIRLFSNLTIQKSWSFGMKDELTAELNDPLSDLDRISYNKIGEYKTGVVRMNPNLGFEFNLTEKMSLSVAPYFSFFLQETNKNFKFYTYGTELGIGYKW